MEKITFVYPQNQQEVLSYLDKNALLYAGGTSIFKRKLDRFDFIVDLSSLNNKAINVKGKGLELESGVSIAQLRKLKLDIPHKELIQQLGLDTASTPLRNQITIGGSIVQCPYWSNFPVYLVAMDASLTLNDVNGDQTELSMSEYYADQQKYKKYYLSKITIPETYGNYESSYFCFKETHFDYSTLNYVLLYNKDKSDYRIVLGAFTRFPYQLTELENLLKEKKKISEKDIESTIDKIQDSIRNDIRFTKEYRLDILKRQLISDLKELEVIA